MLSLVVSAGSFSGCWVLEDVASQSLVLLTFHFGDTGLVLLSPHQEEIGEPFSCCRVKRVCGVVAATQLTTTSQARLGQDHRCCRVELFSVVPGDMIVTAGLLADQC